MWDAILLIWPRFQLSPLRLNFPIAFFGVPYARKILPHHLP